MISPVSAMNPSTRSGRYCIRPCSETPNHPPLPGRSRPGTGLGKGPLPEHVDFFEAIVTAYPDDADHARVARADDIVYGDLILAAVSLHGTDYFNDQYTAHPQPYNPECGCGVCCHLTHEPGPVVVLSNGHPWETCNPWLADTLTSQGKARAVSCERAARNSCGPRAQVPPSGAAKGSRSRRSSAVGMRSARSTPR